MLNVVGRKDCMIGEPSSWLGAAIAWSAFIAAGAAIVVFWVRSIP